MSGTVVALAGKFKGGCLALLDDDGVPHRYLSVPGYSWPVEERRYFSLDYGPTATSCVLTVQNRKFDIDGVFLIDVLSEEITELDFSHIDFDGSVHGVDLLSADGSDANFIVERSANSYGRSFLVRVRGSRVVSRTYMPGRWALVGDTQIRVKASRGEPKRAVLIDAATKDETELLVAHLKKARIEAYLVSPDRSKVIVQHIELTGAQVSTTVTELSVFSTTDGTHLASTTITGGQAFAGWLDKSHYSVQIGGYGRRLDVYRAFDCAKVGEISHWHAEASMLRGGRIWGVDVQPSHEMRNVIVSASLEGGQPAKHHWFEVGEMAGMLPHTFLTFPLSRYSLTYEGD